MGARRRSAGRWLAAAALAAAAGSALLAGCAAAPQQPQQQEATANVVTPSDEPESRRRARIRLELATGYYQEGKTEVALDELKQAIAADPTFGDPYNLRGLVYMRLGDNRQAEESFRRALAINPRDASAHHNYGWLQCQTNRFRESMQSFEQAMANPLYPDKPKTLMAQGLCQARAGQREDAERSLARSYELDAGNPITGYNLARLLYMRGDYPRAQFYIRRLNNSELANAESLWLGIQVENRMNDSVAMGQLSEQLRKRFPQSRERQALDRKAFDE
ncbi:type IV pilus biogenesis/stability protein PilW [Ramlibacter alkalitolerans]|jgi:type IV pilus assembly protein PilF|uniref:Type IV pilus biogenesis/stability protein PilW n=2 Tax=Ramlibacter alkalitolerans TaxID=2039631 RepID=A0ABS1JLK1_9BURK|nr:type IV pilus biogenesis/stability protein PilW [Ramlibacter alkalitolerans]